MNFRLPRFRVHSPTTDLTSHLKLLGVQDAFDSYSAELSGISVDKPYVCHIHHK